MDVQWFIPNTTIVFLKPIKSFSYALIIIYIAYLIIYRKFINPKFQLIVDLRACPSIGYYSLCSNLLCFWVFDIIKECIYHSLLKLADRIYVAKHEHKYVFPMPIRTKISENYTLSDELEF